MIFFFDLNLFSLKQNRARFPVIFSYLVIFCIYFFVYIFIFSLLVYFFMGFLFFYLLYIKAFIVYSCTFALTEDFTSFHLNTFFFFALYLFIFILLFFYCFVYYYDHSFDSDYFRTGFYFICQSFFIAYYLSSYGRLFFIFYHHAPPVDDLDLEVFLHIVFTLVRDIFYTGEIPWAPSFLFFFLFIVHFFPIYVSFLFFPFILEDLKSCEHTKTFWIIRLLFFCFFSSFFIGVFLTYLVLNFWI